MFRTFASLRLADVHTARVSEMRLFHSLFSSLFFPPGFFLFLFFYFPSLLFILSAHVQRALALSPIRRTARAAAPTTIVVSWKFSQIRKEYR